MRSETSKRGEGTHYIYSWQKLVRLHMESQRPNSTIHHCEMRLQQCGINPRARCLLADIKHFHLNNILPDPEFMRIPLKIIPQEIIDSYNLTVMVDDQGWIYMRIDKGMYGLKQAGIIANQ